MNHVRHALVAGAIAALVLAALAVGAAAPAKAIDCDACTGVTFDTLRSDVAAVPADFQQGFLVRVNLAQKLLLPPDPAFPPNPCASANVLRSVGTQASALATTGLFPSGPLGQLAADTGALLSSPAFPPSPCLGTGAS